MRFTVGLDFPVALSTAQAWWVPDGHAEVTVWFLTYTPVPSAVCVVGKSTPFGFLMCAVTLPPGVNPVPASTTFPPALLMELVDRLITGVTDVTAKDAFADDCPSALVTLTPQVPATLPELNW